VVIVNYWRWEDTARVVKQLRAQPALRHGDVEVVIVDNHSPFHPIVPRLRRADGVSLRRWRSNRGFARAVNEGCRLSRGDWLLLLNPDTTVSPGFLACALERAEDLVRHDPVAGILGFRLRNPDGSEQLSTGRFAGLFETVGRLLLPRHRRKYIAPPTGKRSRVDWVTGSCLLVRRECWDDLGGLDPDYFLYYEDVDLCRRAGERGWSVWYDPAVCIVHHRPLHLREVPAHLRLLTRHALLTYARKHWPVWQARLLSELVRAEATTQWLRARLGGDADTARTFAALGQIVNDMGCGRIEMARGRLLQVVRHQEEQRASSLGEEWPDAGALHRRSKPQQARSAA
jgi:GT2 family glycosyltransferase